MPSRLEWPLYHDDNGKNSLHNVICECHDIGFCDCLKTSIAVVATQCTLFLGDFSLESNSKLPSNLIKVKSFIIELLLGFYLIQL